MKDKLKTLLDKFDKCKVECDGFVRIATHELNAAQIEHRVLVGYAFVPNENGDDDLVQPHFWIEVEDEDGLVLTIDYRLRMWVGNHAPHGVFYNQDEYPSVDYRPMGVCKLETDQNVVDVLKGSN